MDKQRIAQELLAVAKDLAADVGDVEVIEPVDSKPIKTRRNKKMKDAASGVSRKRTSIVLDEGDFKRKDIWYGMLDMLDIPHGEEANWDDPTSVDLLIAKAEYY